MYSNAQQCARYLYPISDEMKTFLGLNFVMAINKLSIISHHWDWNNTIGNTGIQNAFFVFRTYRKIFILTMQTTHAKFTYSLRILTMDS